MSTTITASSVGRDVRAVAWWLALGAGAGALAGLVAGGVGALVVALILVQGRELIDEITTIL